MRTVRIPIVNVEVDRSYRLRPPTPAELEARDRALAEVLAMVRHDLRSRVTGLIESGRPIRELYAADGEAMEEYARAIRAYNELEHERLTL